MPPKKRLYYFTPPEHAIGNLRDKQLKVATFSGCNDPFELASFSQKDKGFRKKLKGYLKELDKQQGLLCFCRSWKNPVMWSHYSKNHTGVCYGFDVDPQNFIDVRYVSERLYPDITEDNFFDYVGEDQMIDLFATKFIHWSYEEEVRKLVSFDECVQKDGLNFFQFSRGLKLREVIIGAKSKISPTDIEKTISNPSVDVFMSRLAFQRFEITRQRDKNLWPQK